MNNSSGIIGTLRFESSIPSGPGLNQRTELELSVGNALEIGSLRLIPLLEGGPRVLVMMPSSGPGPVVTCGRGPELGAFLLRDGQTVRVRGDHAIGDWSAVFVASGRIEVSGQGRCFLCRRMPEPGESFHLLPHGATVAGISGKPLCPQCESAVKGVKE